MVKRRSQISGVVFNTGLCDASSAVVQWVVCSSASYYRFQLQTPDRRKPSA